MALSMVKLVDSKRKNWLSKLLNIFNQCLVMFSRVLSFRKKQERNGKSPSCGEDKLAVSVQPASSSIREDLVEEIREEQERSRENPSFSEISTVDVEIPDDLLEEILHRLPVKDLVRWRLVSKEWKSLIGSDYLAEKQLLLHQKKNGLEEKKISFHYKENKTGFEGSAASRGLRFRYSPKHGALVKINKESEEEEEVPRVPGSCNGLVCVYDLVNVYIINPSTLAVRKLFPPLGTKLSVGFGRDVVTGTYKVVVLYLYGYKNRENTMKAVVFDMSTNEWRWKRYKTARPMPLSFTQVSPDTNPVFVNGSIFWLLKREHPEILVMDLHIEKFRTVSLPQDIAASSDPIYMWSLEDRLCVSDLRQTLDSDVWVLVHVTEKWERRRFASPNAIIPPLRLNRAWFAHSLLSPYQSSSPVTYNFTS